MGIVRKSGDPDQPGHALFIALPGAAAPLVKPEAARSAIFAALGRLAEAALDINPGKPHFDSKASAGVRAASRTHILVLDKEFGKVRP